MGRRSASSTARRSRVRITTRGKWRISSAAREASPCRCMAAPVGPPAPSAAGETSRSNRDSAVGEMLMPRIHDRREFLKRTALAGSAALGCGYFTSRAPAESKSPNEKLNIGVIGTANQARFTIGNIRGENVVALCDIDDKYLGSTATEFPGAAKFNDFRKLLERPDLDAVTVCTPDHTHAPATLMALRLGKHVYCEKPLTHNVYEARLVAE